MLETELLCHNCKIIKLKTEFHINNQNKRGYTYRCKPCLREIKNINKEDKLAKRRANRLRKIEIYRQKDREYSAKNRERQIQKYRRHHKKHKEKRNKSSREYKLKNREKCRKAQTAYVLKRLKSDPKYRMEHNLRQGLRIFLKSSNTKKTLRFCELCGCDSNFLMKHIESQFTEGMRWDNYGIRGWVIDHISPCCEHDLTKIEEQKKCFHYSNLRPYWNKDNIIKSIEDRKKSIRKRRCNDLLIDSAQDLDVPPNIQLEMQNLM